MFNDVHNVDSDVYHGGHVGFRCLPILVTIVSDAYRYWSR